MIKQEYKDNADFTCDECKCSFSISSGGFLGSLDDFEFQLSDKDKENKELMECSPFMDFVQLCNKCYRQKNGSSKG